MTGPRSEMLRLVELLRRRPWTTAAVTLVYVAVAPLLHGVAQDLVAALRERVGGSAFTLLFSGVIVASFGAMFVAFRPSLGHGRERRWRVAYLVLGSTLVVAASWLLLAVASEAVHLVQYGVLVLPAFALTGRLGESVIWSTLAGMVDEAYQYWGLHRDWGIYYDFNDVVLNLAGAGLCAALMMCAGVSELEQDTGSAGRRLARSVGVLVLGMLGVTIGIALALGLLALRPGDLGQPAVTLSRLPPEESFWTFAEWSQKHFHILSPSAGLALTALLLTLYLPLDLRFRSRSGDHPPGGRSTNST